MQEMLQKSLSYFKAYFSHSNAPIFQALLFQNISPQIPFEKCIFSFTFPTFWYTMGEEKKERIGIMITLISHSVDETKAIGKTLAPHLAKGMTMVLSGDLGAGKTMFVSGILSYYGKEHEASSPTFTIINEYDLTKDLTLYHFDVYRFELEEEFLAIGGEEFFDKGVCLIEWGEKINHYLPENYIKITINKDTKDENKRTITFSGTNQHYESFLSEVFHDNELISD